MVSTLLIASHAHTEIHAAFFFVVPHDVCGTLRFFNRQQNLKVAVKDNRISKEIFK